MFKEERYTRQVRIFPPKGMNQDIAPLLMKGENGLYIENMLPFPKGEGCVRYGTRLIAQDIFPPQSTIMGMFPAYDGKGNKQIVTYVREFVSETGTLVSVQDNHLEITPSNRDHYQKDFFIQVVYSNNVEGDSTEVLTISSVKSNDNTLVIETGDFSFPEESTLKSVSYGLGSLYVYDVSTHSAKKIKDSLYPHCLPHGVTYKGNLFVCNGVDKVLQWDGTTLSPVQGWVEETAPNIARTSDTTLTFDKFPSFDPNFYQGKSLQITAKGVSTVMDVTDVSSPDAKRVKLTFSKTLPQFDINGAKIFYLKDVPRFSWMRVLHDRIFALGEGVSGIDYRTPDQAMRVFFQYESNSLTGWFSPETKSVPSLDASDKHGIPDNLEAISFVNGYTVLLGRKKTQVWSGSEPAGAATAEGRPVFQYLTSLNVGLMHRNLFAELPNETIICHENGLFSLGTFNIARQFAATPVPAMNQFIKNTANSVLTSKTGWDATAFCFYPQGNFMMFRLGTNKGMVAVIDGSIISFSVFSGDFQWAGSFLETLDNSLYLSLGNTIFQYADENSGVPLYGDSGGDSLISFVWVLSPFTGKRWANKYVQMDVDYPSSFLLKKDNTLSVSVSGNLRESFSLDLDYDLPFKGDIIESVPLLDHSDYDNDNPEPEEQGQRMDSPFMMPFERLRFPASTFFVTMSGYVNSGKLSLKKITFFGHYGSKE